MYAKHITTILTYTQTLSAQSTKNKASRVIIMNVITAVLKDKNVYICHDTTQMSSRFMVSRRDPLLWPGSMQKK